MNSQIKAFFGSYQADYIQRLDIQALVLTTFMLHGVSRPTLNGAEDFHPNDPSSGWSQGLPDAVQYGGRTTAEQNHVVMTERHQMWWYNECKKRSPGFSESQYQSWWRGMTKGDRWTTNQYGWNNGFASYPSRDNLNKEPMRFFTLFTGLTIVKLLSVTPSKIYGDWQYPFECIDASKDLNHITYNTHPQLFYEPMNGVRTPLVIPNPKKPDQFLWLNGHPEYKEDGYQRFDHFNNRAVVPLWMPNTNIAWVRAADVRFLAANEIAPTFNM